MAGSEDAKAAHDVKGKVHLRRADYPLPWLMLLDIKMPRVDGFEVLKWVRQQPGLKSMIVIMLTSSEQIRDVTQAYHLVRPRDRQQLKENGLR